MATLYEYQPQIIEYRYRVAERKLVLNSLRTIFSSGHTLFRGGVYVYFDLKAEDGGFVPNSILYVGETDSHPRRFKNHNLDQVAPGNKRKFIDEYFLKEKTLGLWIFAFATPVSETKRFSSDEEDVDHERELVLLDEAFSVHRNNFESAIVKELRRINLSPPWFSDRERRSFENDESTLQANNLVAWFLGKDGASLDFYMHDDGIELANKMQAQLFPAK